MCGVTGFVLKSTENELSNFLELMTKKVNHRGPDSYANEEFVNNGYLVGLGHTRLKIIDLSDLANQPFFSPDKQVVCAYNGEIYNFESLRVELQSLGHQFRTSSDTEVLLNAYLQWGTDCFEKFNGMWSLALYDKRKDRLILSRDRLGIKPLFYNISSNGIIFGSEIKSILASNSVSRKLNRQGLLDFLSFRQVLNNRTLFESIDEIPPGNFGIFENGCFSLNEYWDLPQPNTDKIDISLDEAVAEAERLLVDSIKLRMISDVPLGTYLSGGLDSSLITAIAKNDSDKLRTYTVGFGEKGFNEFEYARLVAKKHCTDHSELLLSGNDYFCKMDEMIGYKDAPLSVPNEVPLLYLSEKLKENISVVLSGEGADELFGGYGRIFKSPTEYTQLKNINDGKISQDSTISMNLRKKYFDNVFHTQTDHFLYNYSYIKPKDKVGLLDSKFFENQDLMNKKFFQERFEENIDLTYESKILRIFQKTHLQGLLKRLDATTMARSVEARVPFVDHRLVEYVNSLPFNYKIDWRDEKSKKDASSLNSNQYSEDMDVTKLILRKLAAKYLPDEIINRKKVGFPVPIEQWLGNNFKDVLVSKILSPNAKVGSFVNIKALESELGNEASNIKNSHTFWNLYNLEIWLNSYQVDF